MKFIILSSSRGTTMKAVLDAVGDGSLTMECLGLVTDSESRGCRDVAMSAGIPIYVLPKEESEDREAYDKRLNDAIEEMGGTPSDTVVAALGWMFILSPWFVSQWKNKILNVHPSVLPKFPGGNAVADALASGDETTGMTIHVIDEGVDTGPIVLQKECAILPGDDEEALKDRIQLLEKEWYPKVLQQIETGDISL
ncbi:MAG: phosphoribosylglycinamide formyltransferase [Candidatus Peribacteraceae bacterium]|jgi:phosphoribosylglycinamide formyltransferase-1|nr:phosphoribosylglycinamide formyltransferase [Candidatus Peribacteraceae bacterium]MDP7477236.1 phosphoribosylglycinamide formyltransferase [Candidatus Peribacteraceae bacterium]